VDAIADLKAYVEQYPGTDRTDDALYYLGLAYFRSKDYALASGQFDRLVRDFPASPLQPDALFLLARCDDLQSHNALLDQSETERALTRFNQYLELYPQHEKAEEARARVRALRDRLAEKRFRSGRLYYRLHQDQAATIYLRSLIQEYPESRWAGEGALLLADVLVREGNKEEAVAILSKLHESVEGGEIRRRADERLRELQGSGTPR
jgi:outer membrane protein assembly factor BamD